MEGCSRQEVARPHSEGPGQPGDVDDGDVALAALDAADVVAVQAALEAQLFLRPSAAHPQRANPFSDQAFDPACIHARQSHGSAVRCSTHDECDPLQTLLRGGQCYIPKGRQGHNSASRLVVRPPYGKTRTWLIQGDASQCGLTARSGATTISNQGPGGEIETRSFRLPPVGTDHHEVMP